MYLPEIDLPKMANVAGSAVGLLIATCIYLSWVSARYIPTFDRFRSLVGELRGYEGQTKRREALRRQINDYRRRLQLINRTTDVLCWVKGFALATIVFAVGTLVLPSKGEMTATQGTLVKALSLAGGVALLAALVLDGVAIVLMGRENRIDRRAIESEVMDIDEVDGG